MTTDQRFFQDIIHLNAIAYQAISEITGDLNKNIGVSASYIELADQVIGSSVTENYDLASLFGPYQSLIQSDGSELLKQSLQNSECGLALTNAFSSFQVATHISTSLFAYNASMSSSFLSGQIFSFPSTSLGVGSVIIIPYTFDLSGNQFNSHLLDVPIDFAVYGIDNFSGTYNNSKLIKFEYSWSTANSTNLLIKLNYVHSSSNYYLTFYWGNSNSNFISTNYYSNGINTYIGTANFINNIGIYTSLTNQVIISNYSVRHNFWSNTTPYDLTFNTRAFVDPNPYVWSIDRINSNLVDGVYSQFSQPIRYPILNNTNILNSLVPNDKYLTLYSDLKTYGSNGDQGLNANTEITSLYTSNEYQNINTIYLNKKYYSNIPLAISVYQKNPKKKGLNYGNGYSILYFNQLTPSAFVSVIKDSSIWSAFNNSLLLAKTYSGDFEKISSTYLNTLDNFIADYFFGVTFNSVSYYFNEPYLSISRNTLKDFSQPYGSNNTDPIELSEYEEDSLAAGTNIILSKQYLQFIEGKLTLLDDFRLPSDWYFEIFKPISLVCNGIDPYNQGTGLALDYTLNLVFEYQNQNILNKTLYLMASKYLISESDYHQRIDDNQDITGYFYLADPSSTDYNSYSVGSIDEFRLYGYSGYIPDLKDGVTRPILAKAFSPSDSKKYTYEQYVQLLISQGITDPGDISDKIQEYLDNGNSFYTIDLNSFDNKFISLKDISICATNYVINESPYWNASFSQTGNKRFSGPDLDRKGFTQLYATVNSGIVSSPTLTPPYTISNIPVGYNCNISTFDINSLGSNLIAGTYNAWILPPANLISDEQPAQISYNVLNSGVLDPSSIKLITNGSGFYFDFDVTLNQSSFSTSISASYPSIHVNMDNLARFNASVNGSYNLISMTQATAPANGYVQGFKLNPKCFVGLGYTSTADVNILINNFPTVDSFLVANSNLAVGSLENLSSFQNSTTSLSGLNYTSGSQEYLMFEDELYNSVLVGQQYAGENISYLSINCKLILLNGLNPSGTVRANIYTISGSNKIKVASSDFITVNDINSNAYSTLNFPISYTFTNNQQFTGSDFSSQSTYWISIEQKLKNCFIAIQGSYQGITTSNFSISSSIIYNDPNSFNVCGGFSTNAVDLDLSRANLGISSLFSPLLGISSVVSYLRRSPTYNDLRNQISIGVYTSVGGQSVALYSNPISVISLSTTFSATNFTFNTKISTSAVILSSNFIFSNQVAENQIYIARSLSQYDVSSVGFATSSQIKISNNDYNFDFVFNRLFSQVSDNIYAAFNFNNTSQTGLAGPNTLRQSLPQVAVDGYWAFSARQIGSPISIYPRAFYSNSTTIGSSKPTYKYVGYTHNMYLNIGYNSNLIYYQESIILSANAVWKATWMSRDLTNYKNFNEFNVLQQTYLDSIFYHVGLASTNISNNFGPKSAVFEGVFQPSGNSSLQVPFTVGYGTNSGVQVYVNGNSQPFINTFSVISSNFSTVTGFLTTSVRDAAISFKIYYFTLSTAAIEISWNVGLGSTLVNAGSSLNNSTPSPYILNSGNPVDQIVFMNVSKTQSDADSVNSGYPPGDSFIIRSS